ncbi:ATP-binding protein [Gordonia sp. ABSL1-1]|uniref:sensor histidine kinase n=1 Tax=Gordonia sp. ABSL1-1 TaxID=3053923 RepID=UPI0025746CAF|nr:ATP-binding protein [Gordonia sp. ABSL1-1]MDL9937926.1 ATP-binding protein [Gordonia sp. ABSL1-1]
MTRMTGSVVAMMARPTYDLEHGGESGRWDEAMSVVGDVVVASGDPGADPTDKVTSRRRRIADQLFAAEPGDDDRARVQRIGARFLGAGFVGYPFVTAGNIAQSAQVVAFWWVPLGVLLSIGPGLLLFASSFRSGMAWLRPLALLCAGSYLLAIALWFMAWSGEPLADADQIAVWMLAFCGMPSMVLALTLPRLSVVNLVMTTALANTAQQVGRFGHVNSDLVLEVVWSSAFTSVFMAVVVVAVRTGQTLDSTREGAYRKAAAAAAAAARDAEQARFDALIHDRVIASLLAVRAGGADRRLMVQARSALSELDQLAQGPAVPDRHGPVDRDEAARRIRSAATDITDRVDVEIMSDAEVVALLDAAGTADDDADGVVDAAAATATARGPDQGYPADVVGAVVEAMSEALRNVVRHVEHDAPCAVLVALAPDSVSMAVMDDGAGFDTAGIPAGRLGIDVSIRGRMAQLDGGWADVRSTVGRGTTVQIGWERP